MRAPLRIEKLNRVHAVEEFSCGRPELDRFLMRRALQAQQANSSQTYVGVSGKTIVGYYTWERLYRGSSSFHRATESFETGSWSFRASMFPSWSLGTRKLHIALATCREWDGIRGSLKVHQNALDTGEHT